MDDTYRRFNSGRFGPQESITPVFNQNFTQGGSTSKVKKKKKPEEEDTRDAADVIGEV